DRAGLTCCKRRLAPWPRKDASEDYVFPFERLQRPGTKAGRRVAQCLNQFVCRLIPLAPLTDAAIDDLFEVIAALKEANFARTNPFTGITLDQHSEQLTYLVDVISRLPLCRLAQSNVARNHRKIERVDCDSTVIALVPGNSEVSELEPPRFADEYVHWSQISMEHLSAMKLP